MNNHKITVIWAVIAFVFCLFGMWVADGHTGYLISSAGFFHKIWGVILGTLFGFAGAMIGDALRRFTRPDGFFTTGGMGSILKIKLFWMVGPQLIGLFIGYAIGIGLAF